MWDMECAASDCSKEFSPTFPRQKYCVPACREREQAKRDEARKVERALDSAKALLHRQHLPSTFFDGSKREAVLLDIRFELEEDKMARDGTDEIIASRVRALAQAKRAGAADAIYGAYIQLAVAASAAAIRSTGHVRRQRVT